MKRAAGIGASLLIVAAVGGAGLLLWLWLQHDRIVVLPKPTGKYPVGRAALEWVDETRAETLGPDPTAGRELMVWAWYPAAAGAPAAPAAYLPRKWEELRHEVARPPATLLTPPPRSVRPNAVADTKLALDQPTYPVLIMGPGLGFLATDYTALAEELASHGYIVMGVNITYVSSVVVFADGRVARRAPPARAAGVPEADQRKRDVERLAHLWVGDLRFVLDRLAELNAMADPGRFAGRLDLQRVGLLGHSFGGAAAMEACRVDVRCKAGVNLDGYPLANPGEPPLRQPFMHIWSEPSREGNAGWEEAARNAARLMCQVSKGAYQFSIAGMRHLGFADDAVLRASLPTHGSGLEGARGLHITATYLRLFFDRYLRGREAPSLDGTAPEYPEVRRLASDRTQC